MGPLFPGDEFRVCVDAQQGDVGRYGVREDGGPGAAEPPNSRAAEPTNGQEVELPSRQADEPSSCRVSDVEEPGTGGQSDGVGERRKGNTVGSPPSRRPSKPQSRRVAEPPSRRDVGHQATESPSRRAIELPSRRHHSVEPPSLKVATSLKRQATESPSRRSAKPPSPLSRRAAKQEEPLSCRAVVLPRRRAAESSPSRRRGRRTW